ncbi:hypothetical protein ACH0CM_12440 [Streptomyces albus]|uniref:hypothetical protein n=1 Tax=Streptomyces albus TaxID=1888 RepID=UPI003879232C
MTTIQGWLAALSGGDLPEDAVVGSRCLLPPIGCGRPLAEAALTEVEAREWRISGLCPACFDHATHDDEDCDEGRLAEQQHLLDTTDAAFAALAIDHPDRCHTAADYPTWTAGGAA